jgi:hypothetical protein
MQMDAATVTIFVIAILVVAALALRAGRSARK